MVQALPSEQLEGQGVAEPFSQSSPISSTPLPQLALQSASFTEVQPGAQQPSLVRLHAVIAT